MSVFFLIPARKGSKGIPQKNTNILGNKPLISHLVDRLVENYDKDQIIISTDDESIKSMYRNLCRIHDRKNSTANDSATLDEVAIEVIESFTINENDILITCQATSPFISIKSINKTIDLLKKDNELDTIISVEDDRHLRWTEIENGFTPLYINRLNRQYLPPTFKETGGIIASRVKNISKYNSRIGEKVSLIPLSSKEALDIDTRADWGLAEYYLNNLTIAIRVDGSNNMGYGHLYRAIALYKNLSAHNVLFIVRVDKDFKEGYNFLASKHFNVIGINEKDDIIEILKANDCDIVINDILDTDKKYITELKNLGLYVINFEDLGTGALEAHLLINELYSNQTENNNTYCGIEYAIINPIFEQEIVSKKISVQVKTILLTFGGSDPSNLTLLAIKAIEECKFQGEILIVVGPGNVNLNEIEKSVRNSKLNFNIFHKVENMAALISKADIAITSAGRTVTELVSLTTPCIVMCQNIKEMGHTHANSQYGCINLGLGVNIDEKVLSKHIQILISDKELRQDLFKRMLFYSKKRKNNKVVNIILSNYYKFKNENN